MSNYVKIAEENGDRYLNALEKGQEGFLKYLATINQWAPRPPGAYAGMSALRAFSSASFAYSERLLEQQKAFAEQFFAQAGKPVAVAPKAPKASSAPVAKKAQKPRGRTGDASKRSSASAAGATSTESSGTPVKVAAVSSSKKKAGTKAKADKPVNS